VILSSTSPIFTFFLTWAITRHEPATARKLFGVVAGLTGICLIVGAGALSGIGKDLLAQFGLLAAAFSYSCAAIFGRSFDNLDPIVPSAFTVMFASIVLVPVSLVVDRPWTISPSVASLVALAALSVFSTALAYVIYFWLLKTLGSIGVTSQSYLRIPIGVLFGVVFLGETLLTSTWIGLACVMVGVVAMTLPSGGPRKRKPEPVAPE
jgi:drug/metabolite transporter (DMT)-like permease